MYETFYRADVVFDAADSHNVHLRREFFNLGISDHALYKTLFVGLRSNESLRSRPCLDRRNG